MEPLPGTYTLGMEGEPPDSVASLESRVITHNDGHYSSSSHHFDLDHSSGYHQPPLMYGQQMESIMIMQEVATSATACLMPGQHTEGSFYPPKQEPHRIPSPTSTDHSSPSLSSHSGGRVQMEYACAQCKTSKVS